MSDDPHDLVAAAARAQTVADVARLLRELRRREATHRHSPDLTYRQLASRTGWSRASVMGYFAGLTLPPAERLRELASLVGADPAEQAALAHARVRVESVRQTADTVARALTGDVVAPRALPAPARAFTGRTAELARLDELLSADAAAGTVLISAVAGMGGVGKTALAVYWAHSVAGRFPDGQLYVNLRGYDPAEPLSSVDALGVVLAAMGVPPSAFPKALPQRVALYRRLLAGRTMLVLLDNASGVEQVRPLLPPPPCLAVVTSRDDLADLEAIDGARRFTLDVLPEDDALVLLRLLIGERAHREPDAVRRLARLSGHLPLVLRVAAEHAASRPAVALAELAAELSQASSIRLDEFEVTGDERADVRSVLSWSLRRLPAPLARTYRLLGLIPSVDIDAYGLAALVGIADVAEAHRLAQGLMRAHLLQPYADDRYVMHDLVREHAREVGQLDMPPDDRRAAITRLLDYYLATASAAADLQYPDPRQGRTPNRPSPVGPAQAPVFESVRAAADWLAAERDNLVRACQHAARSGWASHAVALALALRWVLRNGHDHNALIVLGEALRAARALGSECDRRDLADVLVWLAFSNRHLGRIEAATAYAEKALAEHTRAAWNLGIAHSLAMLGAIYDLEGRIDESIDCQRRGLEIARRAGNHALEVAQLNNLGWEHLRLEQYEAAADYYRQGVRVSEEIGHVIAVAVCREGLAQAYAKLGRYDEGLVLAEQALVVTVEHDLVQQQVEAMSTIGDIYRRQGHFADAVEQQTAALALCRDIEDRGLTALVLNHLGETHLGAGDPASATDSFQRALECVDRGGDRIEHTRTLVGLGDAHAMAGDTGRARECWTQALQANPAVCGAMASRVEQRLARIDG